MAKKGPLGKAEVFYIENHYPASDATELAADLDRSVSSIKNFIKKNKLDQKPAINVSDQFARQKGSVVMTENASSIADTFKKTVPPKTQSCTTTIKK